MSEEFSWEAIGVIIASVGAAAAGAKALAIWYGEQKKATRRERELRDSVHLPLIFAAGELSNRIYNILELHFLDIVQREDVDQRDKDYVVQHTVFLFAQLFAWIEQTKKFTRALRLEGDDYVLQLSDKINKVEAFVSNNEFGKYLMIWRGEQRAIGELMVLGAKQLPGADAEKPDCIGFSTFCTKRVEWAQWLHPIEAQLKLVSGKEDQLRPRLMRLQHALEDLIDIIDPRRILVKARKSNGKSGNRLKGEFPPAPNSRTDLPIRPSLPAYEPPAQPKQGSHHRKSSSARRGSRE